MYRDLRDRNSVFSGLIATDWTQVGVQWHNQPDLVAAELVSGNYFDVLSLRPALGRLFVASDDLEPDANPVIVLSFSYWQRRFGAAPGILNQSILVNGHPFTVVGVAPPGFHSVVMGDTPDVFVPMMMQAEMMPGSKDLNNHQSSWLNIIGKLNPGISREQAEAGLAPLWYSLRSDELRVIDITGESENFPDRLPQQVAFARSRRRQGILPTSQRRPDAPADRDGHGRSGRAHGMRQRRKSAARPCVRSYP